MIAAVHTSRWHGRLIRFADMFVLWADRLRGCKCPPPRCLKRSYR